MMCPKPTPIWDGYGRGRGRKLPKSPKLPKLAIEIKATLPQMDEDEIGSVPKSIADSAIDYANREQ
jgi:hypothetical protein